MTFFSLGQEVGKFPVTNIITNVVGVLVIIEGSLLPRIHRLKRTSQRILIQHVKWKTSFLFESNTFPAQSTPRNMCIQPGRAPKRCLADRWY